MKVHWKSFALGVVVAVAVPALAGFMVGFVSSLFTSISAEELCYNWTWTYADFVSCVGN